MKLKQTRVGMITAAMILSIAAMFVQMPRQAFAQTFSESAVRASDDVRMYEIKDIVNAMLYRTTDSGVEEVSQVSLSDLADPSGYVLQIDMKDAPTIYAPVSGAEERAGQLFLILDLPDYVQYQGDRRQDRIEVLFGTVEDGVATTNSFTYLLEQMKANPTGTFTLSTDVDMANITIADAALLQEFRGTLDGNGYTIRNMSKPFFQQLRGATVKNIVFENAVLNAGAKGLVANRAEEGSTISNVHGRNVTITAGTSETAALVGTLTGNSQLTNSSVRGLTLWGGGNKRMGGLVGGMTNSTVSNSYAQGSITSGQDGIGGIVGFAQNGKVEKCVTGITISATRGPSYNGGIVGHAANLVVEDTVSLSTGGKAYRVHGTGISGSSDNNFELSSSTLGSNQSGTRVDVVSDETVRTVEFYRDTLGFDENVWNLDQVAEDGLPSLRGENGGEDISPALGVYIPEYERLRRMQNYDPQKDVLYANLYRLMPFYDAAYLVLDGSRIPSTHILNQKVIQAVLPFNGQGKMVEMLTKDTFDTIVSIKIVFKDGSIQAYDLSAAEQDGYFANYWITELNVGYNYAKYLLDQDAAAYQQLLAIAQAYDYATDLDPITSEEDSRIYKDHYTEQVAAEINGVLASILVNTSRYNLYSDNPIAGAKIVEELTSGDLLKQLLYAYNYYDRWYDFEVGGMNMRTVVYLDGALYSDMIKPVNMARELLTSNQRGTNSTHNYYANSIAKYTGKNDIGAFIDSAVLMLTDYTDVNDWFTQSFNGQIYEVGIPGHDEVMYRAWKHIKQHTNTLLPILTVPENSGYIVSMPSQILFGSLRSYGNDVYNKMVTWGNLFKEFYSTLVEIADGAVDRINSKSDLGIDTRYVDGVWQQPGVTEDPFMKNFNEVCNLWAAANGSGAYSTGSSIYWVVYSALNSFISATHETGHNQDGYIFLEGRGRRWQGWGEDYTDGNTTQGAGDGGVNFNLVYNYNLSDYVTTNLTTERINSKEKIYSYYKGMFEAIYYLDYVEAMAFLQLTPEQQAQVGVKVYYPDRLDDPDDIGAQRTGYRPLTVEETTAMNLQTIEDLWDNRINLKVNVTRDTIVGTNQYGYDGIYSRVWYQPHNHENRPDSYSFKRLAWEMLGVAGYTDGYVAYYSGKNRNDLDALRDVTGDDTMTFKQYKMNRFNEVAEKIHNGEDAYTNYDVLVKQYVAALRADAKSSDRNLTASSNLRRATYHHLKRITNDFRSGIYEGGVSEITITSAQQLVDQVMANPAGMFALGNDLDFTGISTAEGSVINAVFMGRLNGNGHTITGLTKPLFQTVRFADIYNLIIRDANITGQQETGALAKTANNIRLRKVHITDSTISGTKRTGGLVGFLIGSYAEECSANVTVNAAGNAVGGIFGELQGSCVKNCYAQGSIVGNADIGGFTGYADYSKIIDCYSAVSVRSTTTNAAGGFVGRVLTNRAWLENNVSFGNTENAYKFDGRSETYVITDKFVNNYEYEGATGSSTLSRSGIDFTGKISVLSIDDAKTQVFYADVLGWDTEVWDLSGVTSGGLPRLRNLAPNSSDLVSDEPEISMVQDVESISNDSNAVTA